MLYSWRHLEPVFGRRSWTEECRGHYVALAILMMHDYHEYKTLISRISSSMISGAAKYISRPFLVRRWSGMFFQQSLIKIPP